MEQTVTHYLGEFHGKCQIDIYTVDWLTIFVMHSTENLL